jgi:hypothetical protein
MVCLAAAASLIACADPTAPAEAALEGSFSLKSVDDGPVPAVLGTSGDVRYVLVSDHVTFDGEGSVHRSRVIRHENVVSGQVTIYSNSFTQDYRVRGDTVEIGGFVPCPINALCVPNEVGTFASNEVVLTMLFDGVRKLTFQRYGLD